MKDLIYSKIKKGLYAIEEDGRVWSYFAKKYMKTNLDKDGYLTLSLKNDRGGYSKFGIHRLLMIAYQPIENMEEMSVNHIDGNKLNNTLENLEWCAPEENTHLAWETKINECRGEKSGKSKLTEEEAKAIIRLKKEGKTYTQIMEEVPKATKNIINSIVNGRTWRHLPR